MFGSASWRTPDFFFVGFCIRYREPPFKLRSKAAALYKRIGITRDGTGVGVGMLRGIQQINRKGNLLQDNDIN